MLDMVLNINQRRTSMTKREIYLMGYNRGWDVATWQDMPAIGDNVPKDIDWIGCGTVDRENQIDVWHMYVSEAESRDRDFSPWEFTAHALNEIADAKPYDVWEVYEDGISAGIAANRRKRFPIKRQSHWS
jgi:hypothetical protein